MTGALLALLAAAAAAAAPAPEAQPPADANLFVYRDHAEPTLMSVALWVDGRRVVRLGQNRWTALVLAPGPHLVELTWPRLAGQEGAELVLTVEPGRTYALEIRARSMFGAQGSSLTPGDPARMRACCRYRPAE